MKLLLLTLLFSNLALAETKFRWQLYLGDVRYKCELVTYDMLTHYQPVLVNCETVNSILGYKIKRINNAANYFEYND